MRISYLKFQRKRTAQADERKDKVATQEHIIEKFIQEQPSIGNIKKELEKSQEEITKDLSEKSTKFGDDLIFREPGHHSAKARQKGKGDRHL
jgi:hypothetical protein